MIIGFDAKRAFANYTGLGNYSRYVINNLSTAYPENEYRLYAPKDTNNPDLESLRSQKNIASVFPKGINKYFSSLWRTKSIVQDLFRDNIQLYHGLSNELPAGLDKKGIRSIVTIHDLIFLRFPDYYKAIDRAVYKRKFRYACQKADHIVTVSECTKNDVISYFDIDPQKISIIYQGCDTLFHHTVSNEEKQRIRKKYHLPETFMLNVGTIESRKNLMLAVKSLLHLDESIHLVAVGRETAYAEQIKNFVTKNKLEKRVHLFSGVPLTDLPAFYQTASVFVYPSFYEGFGIPIIEALYSGVPVIAAIGSCLLEAGGPHSIYVDPDNDEELAKNVKKILSNDTFTSKMITEGKKHAIHFDDHLLADQMITLYKNVLEGRSYLTAPFEYLKSNN
ncbi:MAG: glycosyltransferase family 4 protein [Bacteroidales bacterium]|jgi:glycosyltransferase involved in cell wall biosynthesis|nr:glycosyltransferase family 4 protein [Bacteroidales bacterium]